MDELKKMLEAIKAQLAAGIITPEVFNAKIAEILAMFPEQKKTLDAQAAQIKDLQEKLAKRAGLMDGLQDEKKKFSLLKLIRGIYLRDWKDADFELQVTKEYTEKVRAMDATTGSNGEYLVPPQAVTEIIEMLRAKAVVIQAGATMMTNLVGSPVEIPRQSGGATAYWVAENVAITASDLVLQQISMTPKAVGALVKLSNRLLKLSNPSAEALIQKDIAIALANAIDYVCLRGSSGSGQPTGIANTANINTVAMGAAGGRATFDTLLDMEGELEDDNVLMENLAYIMHGKVKRLLKKTKVAQYTGDTAGQYIILPMSDQNMKDQTGYGVLTSSQIPTNLTKGGSAATLSEIYLGNWRELIIAQWGGLEIASSNVAGDNNGGAFSANQTWIRAIQEVDVAVRHPQSFCLVNDAYTTPSGT